MKMYQPTEMFQYNSGLEFEKISTLPTYGSEVCFKTNKKYKKVSKDMNQCSLTFFLAYAKFLYPRLSYLIILY